MDLQVKYIQGRLFSSLCKNEKTENIIILKKYDMNFIKKTLDRICKYKIKFFHFEQDYDFVKLMLLIDESDRKLLFEYDCSTFNTEQNELYQRGKYEGYCDIQHIHKNFQLKNEVDPIINEKTSTRLLDFLGEIYKTNLYIGTRYNLNRFAKLCNGGELKPINYLRYKLNLPDAVAPFKERASDSGYDLTLIKELKRVDNVIFYDTGVSIEPPNGYYFDLVGRSSISKSGYTIANNVGIIDRTYRGNIIVALVKTNQHAPDLQLPNRLVQIIPRKIVHFIPIQQQDLSSTERNNKGFGSSNERVSNNNKTILARPIQNHNNNLPIDRCKTPTQKSVKQTKVISLVTH